MKYPKILEFNGEEYIHICWDYYRNTEIATNKENVYILYRYFFSQDRGYGLVPVGFIDKDSKIDAEYGVILEKVCIFNSIINSKEGLNIFNTNIYGSRLELDRESVIQQSCINDSTIKGKTGHIQFSKINCSTLDIKNKLILYSSIEHYKGTVDTHIEYEQIASENEK